MHLHTWVVLNMDYEVRQVGFQRISPEDSVLLSKEHLVGVSFAKKRLDRFTSDGSRFERCDFTGAVIGSASFGAGRGDSAYIGCNFDGAKLRMSPGGRVKFVDCSFENITIENWFCFEVELVRCRFSGRIKKAFFNGTVRADVQKSLGRTVNQFEGNDFSRAKLIEVDFRTGIDLSKQKLPDGKEYTYLPDAVAALKRARVDFNAWDDPQMKSEARWFLNRMEEEIADGQQQLFWRPDDFPRDSRVAFRKLLAAAQGH